MGQRGRLAPRTFWFQEEMMGKVTQEITSGLNSGQIKCRMTLTKYVQGRYTSVVQMLQPKLCRANAAKTILYQVSQKLTTELSLGLQRIYHSLHSQNNSSFVITISTEQYPSFLLKYAPIEFKYHQLLEFIQYHDLNPQSEVRVKNAQRRREKSHLLMN